MLLTLPAAAKAPGSACAACHPKETAGYDASAMAHSLGPVRELPSGAFVHTLSGTRFEISFHSGHMTQTLERGGESGHHDISYFVGSGSHATGFLTWAGDSLLQSPVSWYVSRHAWDMAPGYEQDRAPDFDRPVTPECLFCHAGNVRPIRGTANRYEKPPVGFESISCSRCHGDAERHLRAPTPGSIINPAKLPARARDSVCEQCHLSGVSRIPNPGKQITDFRPGQELEEVFSVYVYRGSKDPSRAAPLRVISQAQQLALSACARFSGGKMWCGSCHDPHYTPRDPKSYFRDRCLACHGAKLLASHPKPVDDCIGCHMPKRPTEDGAHTVFTDHYIARRPKADVAADPAEPLVAWHDPPAPYINRNLGLADIDTGRKLHSAAHMLAALPLLSNASREFPHDPEVQVGLGMVLLGTKHVPVAAKLFQEAASQAPGTAAYFLNEGFAWHAAHEFGKAAEALEQALRLDPRLEDAYRELALINAESHDQEALRTTVLRYLKAFPQSMEAQTFARRLQVSEP
jgi:tetratricopeptide (TPR) repeat protein